MQNTKFIFSFIFFILIIQKLETKKLIESLEQTCPSYSFLMQLYNQQKTTYQNALQSGSSQDAVNKADYIDKNLVNRILNIQNLCKGLVGDMEALGKGSFGKVYQTKYKQVGQDDSENVVAKVVRVLNNADNKKDEEEQEFFEIEIEANLLLNQLDVQKYYFPQLYDAVNITEYVDSLDKSDLDEIQLENVTHNENQDLFAIFSEKLDFEFFTYIQILSSDDNMYIAPPEERLNLAVQAIKGLALMNSVYFHCDIKPENMMFKKINPETIQQMIKVNIKPVELMPGNFYQLKYIDFGMVAGGELSERECMGGTNGYKPDEYFNGESNEKFDVYSLGMTLLNFELAINNLGFFSSVDKYIYETKNKNQFVFSEEQVEKLRNNSLVKRMISLMENPSYKELFMSRLQSEMPRLNTFLTQKFPLQELSEIKPSDFIFAHVDIFRRMMMISMDMYFFEYKAKVQDKKTDEYYQAKLDQVTENFNNPPEQSHKNKYEAKMNYLKSKVKLEAARNQLRLKLVGLSLNMIQRNHMKRPSIEEIEQMLMTEVEEFTSNYEDERDDVILYEEELPDNEIYVKPNLESLDDAIAKNLGRKMANFANNRVKQKQKVNYQRFNTKFIQNQNKIQGQVNYII